MFKGQSKGAAKDLFYAELLSYINQTKPVIAGGFELPLGSLKDGLYWSTGTGFRGVQIKLFGTGSKSRPAIRVMTSQGSGLAPKTQSRAIYLKGWKEAFNNAVQTKAKNLGVAFDLPELEPPAFEKVFLYLVSEHGFNELLEHRLLLEDFDVSSDVIDQCIEQHKNVGHVEIKR